jgi:Zn-dependent protease/HSP20 family molecular chaperone IbpA
MTTLADRFGHELPGIPLVRAKQLEILLDATLLVAFALITFQLGLGVLPAWHPSWTGVERWTVALVAAVSFVLSVLAHELAHAFAAQASGTPIRRVTLFLFGGLAELEREPRTPGAEIAMAIAGPAVSLLIGITSTFLGLALAPHWAERLIDKPEVAFAALGPLTTLLLWLGPVNVWLALFNLLPGFPLDGGRLVRALLWWSTGDRRRATRWASMLGRLVAGCLVVFGLVYLLAGAFGTGLWTMLIGWFLYGAARRSDVSDREADEGTSLIRRNDSSTAMWHPFREMDEISSRLSQLFVREPLAAAMADWMPRANVYETDSAYEIQAELPQVSREDLKVTCDDRVLTLSGERHYEARQGDGNKAHKVETAYGSFVRQFVLPDDADESSIDAKFENGMLEVTIPRVPGRKREPGHVIPVH